MLQSSWCRDYLRQLDGRYLLSTVALLFEQVHEIEPVDVTADRMNVLPLMAELAWPPKVAMIWPLVVPTSTLVTYLPVIDEAAGSPADAAVVVKSP